MDINAKIANPVMPTNRIGRKNYVLGLLFFIGSFFALMILLTVILAKIGLDDFIVPVLYILLIPYAIFIFSLHIRRLHDRGHSGLWILLFYIDVWLNIFVKGGALPNKYGDIPNKNVPFFKDIFNIKGK